MKTVFIVISVINFNNSPLSYAAQRSIYSADERLDQTKKTIASIRQYSPESKINLVELGLTDVAEDLHSLVDDYSFVGDKKIVRLAVCSKFKGLGEAISLLYYFFNNKLSNFDFIIKISGRYSLNANFSPLVWEKNKFVFKKYTNSISTRLYGLSRKQKTLYQLYLLACLPFLALGRSIENVMYAIIPKKRCFYVETLGLSGNVGPDGNYINE